MSTQYRNTTGIGSVTVATQPHDSFTISPRFGAGHNTIQRVLQRPFPS
jgi:hypothetical protein